MQDSKNSKNTKQDFNNLVLYSWKNVEQVMENKGT